jgi:hypothetical protein
MLRKAMRHLDRTAPRETELALSAATRMWRDQLWITSEATASGAVCVHNVPNGLSSVTFWDAGPEPPYDATPHEVLASQAAQRYDEGLGMRVRFRSLDELETPLQFLLACGPLVDLPRAQQLLPTLLGQLPPPGIVGLRLDDRLFTPLEWAAKKGHAEVVEWLCTDVRTAPLVRVGAPIGWASYVGRLDVAKTLWAHGADPLATHEALWGGTPPLLAAAQNGKLAVMRWLVEELGQDVRMVDSRGFDVKAHLTMPPNWERLSHAECLTWAVGRLIPPAEGGARGPRGGARGASCAVRDEAASSREAAAPTAAQPEALVEPVPAVTTQSPPPESSPESPPESSPPEERTEAPAEGAPAEEKLHWAVAATPTVSRRSALLLTAAMVVIAVLAQAIFGAQRADERIAEDASVRVHHYQPGGEATPPHVAIAGSDAFADIE